MADNDKPEWIPEAQLAGFVKRITIHCYTPNIKLSALWFERNVHCMSMGTNDPLGEAIFRIPGT